MGSESKPENNEHEYCRPLYLQKFRLYETISNFYMVGRDKTRTFWKVLKIDRLEPSELIMYEDSAIYSELECIDLLKRIHEGNKSTGGLKFVSTCYGIVGFVKFLGPYYMLLITKRRKIGLICGHAVYAVTKSEMFPIPNSTVLSNMPYSKNENRSFVNPACKCKMSIVLLRRHYNGNRNASGFFISLILDVVVSFLFSSIWTTLSFVIFKLVSLLR